MPGTVGARAAVLRESGRPMRIEAVRAGPAAPGDVRVRARAASLRHTDLEAIEGRLAVKLPAVPGHEAAGVLRRPFAPRWGGSGRAGESLGSSRSA